MIRALKVAYVPLIWLAIGLLWLWLIFAAKADEPVYPKPSQSVIDNILSKAGDPT